MASVSESDILRVTQAVWKSVFGLPLRASHAAVRQGAGPRVIAQVQIQGPDPRTVLMDCPAAAARDMAAGFYKKEAGPLPPELVHDVFGELVNMIGGQVKSFLGGPCRLSLPTVQELKGSKDAVPSDRLLSRVTFECGDESIQVAVLRSEGTSRGQGKGS